MGFIKKEILIGFLISIFATLSGLFLYKQYISNDGFLETLKIIQQNKALGKVIALAAIPNLFVFFIFLKKSQDYRAKGVLIATIFTAIITIIIKFM